MVKKLTCLFFVIVLVVGCSKDESQINIQSQISKLESGWLVPLDQLLISQLPADRIKSIDSPHFVPLIQGNINPNEKVYAYRYGNTVKIYPERILGGHEIVNDYIDDHYYAITYCPLTGSAVAWNRKINGEISEFGVSGHLFNENLIPYDRNGNTYWSQMLISGIKGMNGGDELESGQLISTNGESIKAAFPSALILVDTSGNICTDSICIPLKQGSNEGEPGDSEIDLPSGDYFGLVNIGVANGGEHALLFTYSNFNSSTTIIKTSFGNSKIIVIGSNDMQFIIAFIYNSSIPEIDFIPSQNNLPVLFSDNKGNQYDMSGFIISGPDTGDRLISPVAYSAHSFAWESFFGNNIEVYK